MEETGIVVTEKGSMALIRTARTSSCDNCASKKSCVSSGGEEMLIEVENSIGARAGDRVAFTVGAGSVLKAGLALYLAPILCFIGGVAGGQVFAKAYMPDTNADLVAGVSGAFLLVVAFLGLKLYSRRIDKSGAYRPRILRRV